MRTAIIGALGQLGTELQQCLPGDLIAVDRPEIDITDPASIAAVLESVQPGLVINAAAYNLVDRAEDEPQVAYAVNALGPRNLALWCVAADVPLVHVSTDHVFPGEVLQQGSCVPRTTPYTETDPPQPLSAYGVSKVAGEYFVQSICRRHFVVRTSGLYGKALGTKGNFVETMLRLGPERGEVRVVSDQHCTPTSAADLAQALRALISTEAWGLYHGTNTGATTWYDFAREIFRQAGMAVQVHPITTAEFGARARRPGYSILSTERLTQTIGFHFPPWQEALARYLRTRPL